MRDDSSSQSHKTSELSSISKVKSDNIAYGVKDIRATFIRTLFPAMVVPATLMPLELGWRYCLLRSNFKPSEYAARTVVNWSRVKAVIGNYVRYNTLRNIAPLGRIYRISVAQSSVRTYFINEVSLDKCVKKNETFVHDESLWGGTSSKKLTEHAAHALLASTFQTILLQHSANYKSWKATHLLDPNFEEPSMKGISNLYYSMKPGFMIRLMRNTLGISGTCASITFKNKLVKRGMNHEEAVFAASLLFGPVGVFENVFNILCESQLRAVDRATFSYPSMMKVAMDLYMRRGLHGFFEPRTCLIASAIAVIANSVFIEALDCSEKIINYADAIANSMGDILVERTVCIERQAISFAATRAQGLFAFVASAKQEAKLLLTPTDIAKPEVDAHDKVIEITDPFSGLRA
jgi:hypothetical protein